MQMRVRLCPALPRSPAAGLSHRVCNRTFALALRHEPKRDLSFIQAETCRMLFWHAYMPDKKFVTSFEGPPMINGKFCLCQVALDQEDDIQALNNQSLGSCLERSVPRSSESQLCHGSRLLASSVCHQYQTQRGNTWTLTGLNHRRPGGTA